MKQYFRTKEDCPLDGIRHLHPEILNVLFAFVEFCNNEGLPCVITNFLVKFFESETETHPDGRAFDASIRGIPKEKVDEIVQTFNDVFAEKVGAASRKDGIKRCCVFHDVGLGSHLHFQVGKHVIFERRETI